jgi:hypothetical protein
MAIELLEIGPETRTVINAAAKGRLRLVPLSIKQYHRMIDETILPENTSLELIDGMLASKDCRDAGRDPMVIGEEHAYVVNRLPRLDRRLGNRGIYGADSAAGGYLRGRRRTGPECNDRAAADYRDR